MRTSLLRTLVLTAAVAALAACASTSRNDPKTGAALPTQQWDDNIKVHTYADEVLLALHANGLSPAQGEALQAFVQRWMLAEGGAISVRAPQVRGGPTEGAGMAEAARDFLVAQGAPAWRVNIVSYDSTGAQPGAAPLVVSFDRHQVETPLCGTTIENLSRSASNRSSSNFGCAVTSNLAAQLADPGDLINPRDMDPADAGRRATVLGRYRRGELTASPREEQAVGTVSKAVN